MFAAIGTATVAPLVPSSTKTASATSPCQLKNQAWVAGGLLVPYLRYPSCRTPAPGRR
jgi:hypothetical protein